MLTDDIGYVYLYEFAGDCADKFAEAVKSLNEQGAKGLIIDLRDNPGGWVNDAESIADLFLDKGTLCYLEYKDGSREYYNTKDGKYDMKLVVLVNENSASSSEILTGALKDRGDATVVGVKSYGKGIVQTVIPLDGGAGMQMTIAQYYTPNGNAVHKLGITPDVECALPEPNVTSVLMQNPNFRIALDVTELFAAAAERKGERATLSMGCVIVRRDFAEKNPDQVKAFMDAYAASVAYVNENVADASQMVEAQGIMPKAAVAAKAIPNCHIVFIAEQEMKDAIQPFFQILFNANPKSVGGALPADDFYYLPDPVLTYKVPEDGFYILKVHDNLFRGGPNFVYSVFCRDARTDRPLYAPRDRAFACYPQPASFVPPKAAPGRIVRKGSIDIPGRVDRQIVVDVPDVKGRERILNVHAKNKPLGSDVDLSSVAKLTPGFSGADLANLLNEAALLTARRNKKIITQQEVSESMERVIAGPERKGRVMDDQTKHTIAYHESGHALVGHLLPKADPVHKISIISRGRALGYTLSIPKEDKVLNTVGEMRDELAVFMGGRVAEEIFCDDASRLQMFERVGRGRMLPLLVIFLCVMLPGLLRSIAHGEGVLVVMLGIIVGLYIYLFARFLCCYRRLRDRDK